ncbi:hypothetical protein LPTSP3_g14890 [Leptospira kobayashii]|uniref:Beta-propeller repeat protein n=1 Tax=Leptospira kobayashii TaxID=1917830 RepID=A0ABM7UIS4_9LEPT|nr:SBBP repeat-containing protein [Leptospira kobayashii]BDA78559.1 hypothetical protein LPTSP3_g14890 [Leptospira kobayashii]
MTLGLCLALFSGCNSPSDDKAIGALIPFLQGSGTSSSTNTSTPTDTSTTTTCGTAVLLGASGKTTYGQGITSDSSGNVYITGYTNGNLGGQTLTGNQDIFLAKYDSGGTKR